MGVGGAVAVRAALDRPRLWHVTAALFALLLCGLVLVCSQGSLTIIANRPATARQAAAALPPWEPWCTKGTPREERKRLTFFARIEGRVLASTHGPTADEAHVAVISDFHIVLVRLPNWEETPQRGAKIVAIGPLFRARDGQREVQAFRFETT
jgi:pimeloyl-ACP methyl ester carboxylesterase